MGNDFIGSITTVLLALVSVAIIAVILSKNSNTAGVLSAGSSAFTGSLGAALSPVTGGSAVL